MYKFFFQSSLHIFVEATSNWSRSSSARSSRSSAGDALGRTIQSDAGRVFDPLDEQIDFVSLTPRAEIVASTINKLKIVILWQEAVQAAHNTTKAHSYLLGH